MPAISSSGRHMNPGTGHTQLWQRGPGTHTLTQGPHPVLQRHQHHVPLQQLARPRPHVAAQHEGAAVDVDHHRQPRVVLGARQLRREDREVEAVLAAQQRARGQRRGELGLGSAELVDEGTVLAGDAGAGLRAHVVPPAQDVAGVARVVRVVAVIEGTLGPGRGEPVLAGRALAEGDLEEVVDISAGELRGPRGALQLAHPRHHHARARQAVEHSLV